MLLIFVLFLIFPNVVIDICGNHHSFQEKTRAKTAISGQVALVSFPKRPPSSFCSGAERHQGHFISASLNRSPVATQNHCNYGDVEYETDTLEVSILQKNQQSHSIVLWPMRKTLGRGDRWELPACSSKSTEGAGGAILCTLGRGRPTVERTFLGQRQMAFAISQNQVADSSPGTAAQEPKKEQKRQREGQVAVAVPSSGIARSTMDVEIDSVHNCCSSFHHARRTATSCIGHCDEEERVQPACRLAGNAPRDSQGSVAGHDEGFAFSCHQIGQSQEDPSGCKSFQDAAPQCVEDFIWRPVQRNGRNSAKTSKSRTTILHNK